MPGINANVTAAVLTSDGESYGGSWTAPWKFDDGSGSGRITATVVVDVTARMFRTAWTVDGPLLAAPIPAINADIAVDSYVYDDNGNFEIRHSTSVGDTKLTSNGGFGKFKLHIDIAGRSDTVAFEATGVANRPSLIPIAFTIVAADGSVKSGTIEARPG